MKIRFVVFKLDNAVTGIENTGIIYDEHSFVLNYCATFFHKTMAIEYIESEIKDRAERGFESNLRYIINEVYHTTKDDIIK